jgi:hypothetical protein
MIDIIKYIKNIISRYLSIIIKPNDKTDIYAQNNARSAFQILFIIYGNDHYIVFAIHPSSTPFLLILISIL